MKKKFLIGIVVLLMIFPVNIVAKDYENINYNMVLYVVDDTKPTESNLNQPSLDDEVDVEKECSGIFSGNFGKQLKQILNIIKFFVPILIVGLAVVDFIKATASQNQDELKKAANRFVKRLIIGILVFVLPTILEFILKLAGIEFGVCTLG